MDTKELIRCLKFIKGDLIAPILAEHDCYMVKVVKQDLIACLALDDPKNPAPFSIQRSLEDDAWILIQTMKGV